MDNDFENKIRAARNVKLTEQEKSELKRGFSAFMDANPTRDAQGVPVRSLFAIRLFSGALAAAVFVAYVGFSEASLPGGAMYFFKTKVNEPIAKSFALTAESKADISVALLERRLEEAAHLGLEQSVPKADWITLLDEIKYASDDVAENVERLASGEHAARASSVSSEQAAVLDAHEEILEGVAGQIGQSELDSVVEEIRKHKMRNRELSAAITSKLEGDADIEDSAMESLDEVRAAINGARTELAEEVVDGDSDSADSLDVAINHAEELVEEGNESLNAGDHDGAFLRFEESRRLVRKSLTVLAAEDELGIDLNTDEEVRVQDVSTTTEGVSDF